MIQDARASQLRHWLMAGYGCTKYRPVLVQSTIARLSGMTTFPGASFPSLHLHTSVYIRTSETDRNPASTTNSNDSMYRVCRGRFSTRQRTLPQHNAHLQVSPVDDGTSSCGVRSSGDQPSDNDVNQGCGLVAINTWKCLFPTPSLAFPRGPCLPSFMLLTRERRDLLRGEL